MAILFPIIIILVTIISMEISSWAIHKFLFHGPLWFIHKTHHQERHGFFELNDVFSLFFGLLAVGLMWFDQKNRNYPFWIGAGISVYGIIYFIFHDWFIHNRFKAFKLNNRYFAGIKRAHKIHHKSMHKNPSEEFGLLVAAKSILRNKAFYNFIISF